LELKQLSVTRLYNAPALTTNQQHKRKTTVQIEVKNETQQSDHPGLVIDISTTDSQQAFYLGEQFRIMCYNRQKCWKGKWAQGMFIRIPLIPDARQALKGNMVEDVAKLLNKQYDEGKITGQTLDPVLGTFEIMQEMLDKQSAELKRLHLMERKVNHGCWDAYCKTCEEKENNNG
jgi:hypothetical protein